MDFEYEFRLDRNLSLLVGVSGSLSVAAKIRLCVHCSLFAFKTLIQAVEYILVILELTSYSCLILFVLYFQVTAFAHSVGEYHFSNLWSFLEIVLVGLVRWNLGVQISVDVCLAARLACSRSLVQTPLKGAKISAIQIRLGTQYHSN